MAAAATSMRIPGILHGRKADILTLSLTLACSRRTGLTWSSSEAFAGTSGRNRDTAAPQGTDAQVPGRGGISSGRSAAGLSFWTARLASVPSFVPLAGGGCGRDQGGLDHYHRPELASANYVLRPAIHVSLPRGWTGIQLQC